MKTFVSNLGFFFFQKKKGLKFFILKYQIYWYVKWKSWTTSCVYRRYLQITSTEDDTFSMEKKLFLWKILYALNALQTAMKQIFVLDIIEMSIERIGLTNLVYIEDTSHSFWAQQQLMSLEGYSIELRNGKCFHLQQEKSYR